MSPTLDAALDILGADAMNVRTLAYRIGCSRSMVMTLVRRGELVVVGYERGSAHYGARSPRGISIVAAPQHAAAHAAAYVAYAVEMLEQLNSIDTKLLTREQASKIWSKRWYYQQRLKGAPVKGVRKLQPISQPIDEPRGFEEKLREALVPVFTDEGEGNFDG